MTGQPSAALAGRRIVVTRAAEQAGELARRIRSLGGEALEVPLIEIVAPSDGGAALTAALQQLDTYDWLIVTSPNGADRVREAVLSRRREGRRGPRIAAVGTATRRALGTEVDLVPERQIGASLVAAFPAGRGRVLLAQAEQAEPVVREGLVAKGWSVDVVAAYRTEPRQPSAEVLLEVLAADAVLFASGSAARSWARVFGTATPSTVFAIGPTTAQVAGDLGLKVDAVATDHSLDGLVDSVLLYWSDPG